MKCIKTWLMILSLGIFFSMPGIARSAHPKMQQTHHVHAHSMIQSQPKYVSKNVSHMPTHSISTIKLAERLLSMENAVSKIMQQNLGRILKIDPVPGQPLFKVRLLSANGKVSHVLFDRRTGQVMRTTVGPKL